MGFLDCFIQQGKEPEPKAIECMRCKKYADCQFAQQYIFCRILKHVLDGGTCPAYDLDPSVDK